MEAYTEKAKRDRDGLGLSLFFLFMRKRKDILIKLQKLSIHGILL